MANIIIGSFILDDTYTPLVNLAYEYFKTEGGEIIGGLQKYTISGTVTIGDDGASLTGASVMTKLKNIRQLGKKTKCVDVVIPNFYSGTAKITNVQIDQGPDPSWVNQGDYSIEITAPLSNIPTNSLGITAEDCVTDISKSETIEIGEDAHGYILLGGNQLTKTFITFKLQISLTCKPLCSTNGINVVKILKRLASTGPTNKAFEKYLSWTPYLQNRSLELSTDGTANFSADVILLPPNATPRAFIDLEFEHSHTYESKQQTKKISGTVTGLASIPWTELVTLQNTSLASKLTNAESAFATVKGLYSDISSWNGITLELLEIPNCPRTTSNTSGQCGTTDPTYQPCFQATTSNISKARTDGTINFTFEWATQSEDEECADQNGKRTEITVDITEPQANIVEHIIPDVGTLVQNLNCRSAKTIDFTSTTTDPKSDGCATANACVAEEAINEEIKKYIPEDDDDGWLLIEYSKTETSDSFSIKKKYIRKCLG